MTGAPSEIDWDVMSSEVMGVSHSPTGAVLCTAMTVMLAAELAVRRSLHSEYH